MAEDIRSGHSEVVRKDPRDELVVECARQEENCAYTASNLYIWQKQARLWRAIFLLAPIFLGGFASSQILAKYLGETGEIVAAIAGLAAGFFPAIYISLNMDMRVAEIGRSAVEFTNLRDRFRQAGKIRSQATIEEFQAEFEVLMDRMDSARNTAPPAPEWCFQETKRKFKSGDYAYTVDEKPKRRG